MRLISRRSSDRARDGFVRSRWAAVGAALSIAATGLLPASASVDSGERAVFVPITPCRLVDTRPAPDTVGLRPVALGPNEAYPVQVRGTNGNCTIPNDAVGVVMNVAAIAPTAGSFLTVYPSDATRPLAANLNWTDGQPPLSNAVTADLSADGKVSFYNLAGTVHIAADIVGYFVDHTHDDRYYTKAQVDAAVQSAITQARHHVHHDSYNPYSMITHTGALPSNISNCTQTGGGFNSVPLTVPVGARLISIEVDMIDGASATLYSLQFSKYRVNATGSTLTTLASASAQGGGTGSATRVHHTLTPAVAETIDTGESLYLEVNATMGNAFCGATFNYETFD